MTDPADPNADRDSTAGPENLTCATAILRPRMRWAIGSLVLGAVSLPLADPVVGDIPGCVFAGLAGLCGVILGVIALALAIRRPLRYGGKLLAVLGMMLAAGSLLRLGYLTERMRHTTVRTVHCLANVSAIGQALQAYYSDHSSFPDNLNTLVAVQLITRDQLQCPFDQRPDAAGFDYKYVAGLTNDDPGGWILAYEDPPTHDQASGCVLYLNGHVGLRSAAELKQEVARFREALIEVGRAVEDTGAVLRVSGAPNAEQEHP